MGFRLKPTQKTSSHRSFLSDGKDYRALLTNNSSEFLVVFYADNKYRIAACTDVGGPLSFTVKDHKDNMLFTNKNHENAAYWDLVFPTTIECLVTIALPDETKALAFGEATPASAEPADSTAAEGDGDEAAVAKPKTEHYKTYETYRGRLSYSPDYMLVQV